MQSGKTVTGGVVLRVTDTKETDRILTVLTGGPGEDTPDRPGCAAKGQPPGGGLPACLAYSELTIFKRGQLVSCWMRRRTIELFDGLRPGHDELLSAGGVVLSS